MWNGWEGPSVFHHNRLAALTAGHKQTLLLYAINKPCAVFSVATADAGVRTADMTPGQTGSPSETLTRSTMTEKLIPAAQRSPRRKCGEEMLRAKIVAVCNTVSKWFWGDIISKAAGEQKNCTGNVVWSWICCCGNFYEKKKQTNKKPKTKSFQDEVLTVCSPCQVVVF